MSKQWECRYGHAPSLLVCDLTSATRHCPLCSTTVSEAMLNAIIDEAKFSAAYNIWAVATPKFFVGQRVRIRVRTPNSYINEGWDNCEGNIASLYKSSGRPSNIPVWDVANIKHPIAPGNFKLHIPEANLEAIDNPQTYIGTATIPDRMSKNKDVDPKKEALYKRWTNNAGSRVNQANCGYQYPGVEIQGYPGTPWFHGHEERIVSARAQMKRWVSSNHKDWPTCQHGHAINLVQIVREAKGGDGYLAFPKFECWGCR